MDIQDRIEVIANAWAEIIPGMPIGEDDDFLEIGGSSMQMLAMISELEETFGRHINILALEDGVTPGRLAQLFS